MKIYIVLIFIFSGTVYSQSGPDNFETLLSKAEDEMVRSPEKSIVNAFNALEMATRNFDSLAIARAEHMIGEIYLRMNQFEEAENSLLSSLRIMKEIANSSADSTEISALNSDLGKLYGEWKKLGNSEKYYKNAIEFLPESNEKQITEAEIYKQLGRYQISDNLIGNNRIESIRKYLLRAKKIFKEKSQKSSQIETIGYLAKAEQLAGHNDKAMEYLNSAFEIAKSVSGQQESTKSHHLTDSTLIARILNQTGKYYYDLGDYDKAKEFYEKALNSRAGKENAEIRSEILMNLTQLHFYLGNGYEWGYNKFEKPLENMRIAYEYLKELKDLSDSIYEQSILNKFTETLLTETKQAESRLKQDSAAKVRQISGLEESNKKKEVEIESKSRQILYLVIGLLLLGLVAVVIYSRFSLKKKLTAILEDKNDQLESKNVELESLNNKKDKLLEIINSDLDQASEYVVSLLRDQFKDEVISTDWKFIPSAKLGGDCFGYHGIDDRYFAIYLLDVSGHGVGPALHAVSALSALRNENLPETDFRNPSEVLTKLNNSFLMDDHNGMFISMWYGVFDYKEKILRFSAAGHPPALIFGQSGKKPEMLVSQNLILGGMPGYEYGEEEFEIKENSTLYVYSDGAYEVEKPDGEMMDVGEMAELLSGFSESHENEMDALYEHLSKIGGELDDDFSILKIRFNLK